MGFEPLPPHGSFAATAIIDLTLFIAMGALVACIFAYVGG